MLRFVNDGGLYVDVWTAPDWPCGDATTGATAVQVWRHLGGIAHYALLGAIPASTSSIELAPAAEDSGAREPLQGGVRFGLLDEYRVVVEQAFALASTTPMRVVLAAHHDAESALVAFFDATKVLSALMSDEAAVEGTDEDLVALARAALRNHPYAQTRGETR